MGILKNKWQDHYDAALERGASAHDAEQYAYTAMADYAASLLDRADDARDREREERA